MVTLWEKMGDIYGAVFLNQFGPIGGGTFETWCQYLADLSSDQIETGFASMLRDKPKYVPHAQRFREYCVGTGALGLPDAKSAYLQACMAKSPKDRQKYSHPAVYYAGVATGWAELKNFGENQIFPRYKMFYEQMVNRVANGEDLTLPMVDAIPEKIEIVLDLDEQKQRLAKLAKDLDL